MEHNGKVRQLSDEEFKKVLTEKVATHLPAPRIRHHILNDKYREFFESKGKAFKELWLKRMNKGMSQENAKKLQTMVDEFHKPLDAEE